MSTTDACSIDCVKVINSDQTKTTHLSYNEMRVIIEQGDHIKLKQLIENGQLISTPLLHIACQYGQLECTRLLLAHNSERKISLNTEKALVISSEYGHIEIIKLLQDSFPSISFITQYSAFFMACRCGRVGAVTHLYNYYKLDVNFEVDDDKCYPMLTKHTSCALIEACQGGSLEVVRVLIDLGAKVNIITTLMRESPLVTACENNHRDIVKFLFESGAVLSPFNSVLHPALYTTTKKGYVSIVQELLLHIHFDYMSDITNTVTENGKSEKRNFVLLLVELLTHVVSKGSTDIVQLLVDYSSSIKYDEILKPWRNWLYTFFTTACKHQHISTARLLLERGVDCNRVGIDYTYIVLTLFTKPEPHCLELLTLLFEYNVNVDVICPVTGTTALLKACDMMYYECIQALLASVLMSTSLTVTV